MLPRYSWPGNVRELRNVVERVVIMNPDGPQDRAQTPAAAGLSRGHAAQPGEFSTLHQARAAYERDYILKKLDENHGNISRTADALGLERSHMYRKMKALGIAVKEKGKGLRSRNTPLTFADSRRVWGTSEGTRTVHPSAT